MEHARFSFYKKVLYKKAVIDWPKPEEIFSTSSKKFRKWLIRWLPIEKNYCIDQIKYLGNIDLAYTFIFYKPLYFESGLKVA